jgi:hypothetical protein
VALYFGKRHVFELYYLALKTLTFFNFMVDAGLYWALAFRRLVLEMIFFSS